MAIVWHEPRITSTSREPNQHFTLQDMIAEGQDKDAEPGFQVRGKSLCF